MNIITYHSSNAKPHEAWLAYVELANGEQWLVRCTGHTELEAKTKCQVLWDREQKKYALSNAAKDVAVPDIKRGDLREKFAGKVWVINRSTHHLCRIDPSELVSYEAKGYVRGGPRSK
jgi:hypothetical protein